MLCPFMYFLTSVNTHSVYEISVRGRNRLETCFWELVLGD
uniref:Uncharacterized protein n=1 Tax=Anguilla anguilla TaxID=7936 RepID=A0A0E9RJ40_ANGAN